jgi:hypothetical protein
MDDLDRLLLLQTILNHVSFEDMAYLKLFPYDMKKIFDSIDVKSGNLKCSFGQMWVALKVIGWGSERKIANIKSDQISYLCDAINSFKKSVNHEIDGKI